MLVYQRVHDLDLPILRSDVVQFYISLMTTFCICCSLCINPHDFVQTLARRKNRCALAPFFALWNCWCWILVEIVRSAGCCKMAEALNTLELPQKRFRFVSGTHVE